MSTNYYAVINKVMVNPETIHIGKKSSGWLFAINDCEKFHTFSQLKKWLKANTEKEQKYKIFNEYNDELTADEMIKIIEDGQTEKNINNPDNFKGEFKNIDGYRFCMLKDWF